MVTVLDGAFIQVFLLTIRRDHQPGTEAVRALEEGEGKECLPAGWGVGRGAEGKALLWVRPLQPKGRQMMSES